MVSSYKFIQKLWTLHKEIVIKIKNEKEEKIEHELRKFTNEMIAKITNNVEKFNYNVIVANMYETYNYLINYIKTNSDIKNLEQDYKKILICFSPVIPHFTSECLDDLNSYNSQLNWPSYDQTLLNEKEVNFVVQINGKKRALLSIKKDIEEKDLLLIIKKDKIVDKYLGKKEIKKIVFVKNRLINILVNE